MTSIHPLDCESYREETLVTLGGNADAQSVSAGVVEHRESCGSCQAWHQEALLLAGVLGSMDRLVAPLNLEDVVCEDIELGAGAHLSALRGLEAKAAPAELGARLALDMTKLASEEPLPKWVSLLEDLPQEKAPLVLDRLVAEELADSEKAITKRFVGGLFRRQSPEQLETRLSASLKAPEVAVAPRLRLLKWSSAAAAALVIWVSVPAFQAGATQKFRFEIVEVANLQELSPFARSLASDLTGGMLDNMQSAPVDETTDGGGL